MPILDEQGDVVEWVGTCIDLTERRAAEAKLRQSAAELQAANASLYESRRAAINLMDDAVAARRLAEQTSGELLEEIAERQRTDEALAKERANLQAVFDVVNVGMLVIDEDGVVKRVNDTVPRWVGRGLSASGGQQPGDLLGCAHALADPTGCGKTPHCDLCPIRKTFESVLRTGQPLHDVETEATLSLDGKEVRLWLEVSADPLVLDGKRHVILAMNNVTARHQAEEEAVWLASFPTLNPGPIVEADLEGNVHFLNPAAETLFPDLQERPMDQPWLAGWQAIVRDLLRSEDKRIIRDVAVGPRWCQQMIHYVEDIGRIRIYGTDITERKRAEGEREITIKFLELINEETDTADLVRAAATFFQEQSGCQAVGIRLREGDDFPYFEARGFPPEFIQSEDSLCARDGAGAMVRDDVGNPVIECMCGSVICRRFDPAKPFFTAHGSFWTNSTTELLASTMEADRQARTRNRCNGEGYESVALLPLRMGEERLGLLQLNDRRRGMFSAELIGLWERLADHLGVALAKLRAEEQLAQVNQDLSKLNRTLKALRNSEQTIVRAVDEPSYLEDVCRIVVEDCGHAMVWIGYAEDDEEKTVRPVAHSGFDEGYLKTLNVTWADNERGRGPTGTAIRSGKPCGCRDMRTDRQFAPWRDEALRRGYASSIALPLMADGKSFGAVTIYSREPESFLEEEAALLTQLADDLSYGIRRSGCGPPMRKRRRR